MLAFLLRKEEEKGEGKGEDKKEREEGSRKETEEEREGEGRIQESIWKNSRSNKTLMHSIQKESFGTSHSDEP